MCLRRNKTLKMKMKPCWTWWNLPAIPSWSRLRTLRADWSSEWDSISKRATKRLKKTVLALRKEVKPIGYRISYYVWFPWHACLDLGPIYVPFIIFVSVTGIFQEISPQLFKWKFLVSLETQLDPVIFFWMLSYERTLCWSRRMKGQVMFCLRGCSMFEKSI